MQTSSFTSSVTLRLVTAYVALPLSPQEVVQIVHQAADALQHAHNRRLLHLDVKPSNFLLRHYEDASRYPDVLLADFGIAKFATTTSTASQTVRGTPPYMAPEQWAGTPVAATDQYALAIMAYQLLTGRFPFEGNMQQVMYKHLQERPQPPSAFNPNIPPSVDSVILKALEKKPEDRFSSIQALETAFEQAWGPTETYVPPPLPPTEYTAPAPPRFPMGATKLPPTQYAFPAPSPTTNKPGISRRTVIAGLGGLAVIAAAGGGLAWLVGSHMSSASPASTPQSGSPALYIYTGHSGTVLSVTWSPSGLRIASGSTDSTVQVWDAANGGNAYTYAGHTNQIEAVAWSPDGTRIASGGVDTTVQIWDATGK